MSLSPAASKVPRTTELTFYSLCLSLTLSKNQIEETGDLLLLAAAAREHPTLEYFNLEGCGIGSKCMTMRTIVPDLLALHTVNLASNDIGSRGAAAISPCYQDIGSRQQLVRRRRCDSFRKLFEAQQELASARPLW